jgi:hypothetical protein
MSERDMMRSIGRGSALAALVIGWGFIAWNNHFHITAPLVFVCLGYLAVVATIYNLWRTGIAVVASPEDDGDSTWAKPAGALGELEREKRTLLKAIKEAEFDHQMGKLSKRDVDDMIRTYRARAIEVFKEIERVQLGTAGSAREQIMREVRARVELEARSQKKPAGAGAATGAAVATGAAAWASRPDGRDKGKKKPSAASQAATTAGAAVQAAEAAEVSDAAVIAAGTSDAAADGTAADAAADAPTEAAAAAPALASSEEAGAAAAARKPAQATLDDETMDADSTTAMEPKRDDPVKEATP